MTRAAVMDELTQVRNDLLAALDRVPSEGWDRPTPGNPRWSVSRVAAHLALTEDDIRTYAALMARFGLSLPYADWLFDLNNATRLRLRRHADPERTLLSLGQARARTIAYVESLPEERLLRAGFPRIAEAPTVEEALLWIGRHERDHIKELSS